MAFSGLGNAPSEHDRAVDGAVVREDRRACLDAVLRMAEMSDRWGAADVLEFAEYIRTGAIPDPSKDVES